jgi:predicted secreted Zn-dependent protease
VRAAGGWPQALGVCIFLVACAAGEGRVPEDRVREKTERYPISGRSAQELRWALDRLGPLNDEGRRSDAVTKWHFEYSFGVARTSTGCALDSLETNTEITTILPRWSAEPGVPEQLLKTWEEYAVCAELHETGHRRIYLDAVARFRKRAERLESYPTCEEVGRALDGLAEDSLRKLKEDQVEYEGRTDHGYLQCGRFP